MMRGWSSTKHPSGTSLSDLRYSSVRTSRLRVKLRRATGGRAYIFVNSRRIREFLPRFRRRKSGSTIFLPS